MGQHIASTMAQLVAEELEVVLEGHGDHAGLERSEIQRSDPRRRSHRRQLEHRNELRRDVSRRRRWPDHAHQGGGRDARRTGKRTVRERFACASCEVEEEPDLRADRVERQGEPGLVRRRPQGDQAEDAGPVHEDRPIVAATRHSGEDERHRQVRHRRLRAGHAVRQARAAAGPLRRDGEVSRRQRGQEECRASSRPSWSRTRPPRPPAGSSPSRRPTKARRRPRRRSRSIGTRVSMPTCPTSRSSTSRAACRRKARKASSSSRTAIRRRRWKRRPRSSRANI